jgi:hypothetical protein
VQKEKLENYLEIIKLILPVFLVEHFDLTRTVQENDKETLHLYFDEKNIVPEEHAGKNLISKGFHDEITIQDFPLRGNHVFLHIKRRRWTNKVDKSIVQRNWNLVAKGSRMTEEFAAFLKEINRF